MVRWVHIISVGTSLLGNFERSKPDLASKLGVKEWFKASPNDEVQDVALGHARVGDPIFDSLLKFVKEGPEEASAELNAFLKYVRLNSHVPPKDVGVLLYSTDTGTCYLCASVISKYLRSKGYYLLSPKPLRIEGLGRCEELFDDALTNLLDKVVTKVAEWSRKDVPVYINATGGFKAETQFLVLAAAVSGAKAAYYIHETFKEVIELPLPPLRIDPRIEELVKYVKQYGVMSKSELEMKCMELGLDPKELEVDRKLIKNNKLRKWLLSLIKTP